MALLSKVDDGSIKSTPIEDMFASKNAVALFRRSPNFFCVCAEVYVFATELSGVSRRPNIVEVVHTPNEPRYAHREICLTSQLHGYVHDYERGYGCAHFPSLLYCDLVSIPPIFLVVHESCL